jgi:transcriptional regulator with XRE-family HTH domain
MNQITYRFGEKLRTIRERRGMTMKTLADHIGVSESLISQIERDKVSPSLDTLIAIVEVLEIDLEYLFNELKRTKEVSLVRREHRNSHVIDGVRYQQLSRISDSKLKHHIEAVLIEIPRGEEKGSSEYGHLGRELGYVLKGAGCLEYGTETYNIGEGDSISFSSDIPHCLKNTGEKPLQAVWIITPPRMFLPKGGERR